MNEFWKREVLRVKYFKQRFEIREEEFKRLKQKKDLETAEDSTSSKTVLSQYFSTPSQLYFDKENLIDEEDELEREYQEQALLYINDVIKGVKVDQEIPPIPKPKK